MRLHGRRTATGWSSRYEPNLLEREFGELESAIKLRNYSNRTLKAYRFWVGRFQAFASSQNQAFNVPLFFFRHVLRRDFGEIDGVVRAKRHRYIPVVLSRDEVEAILAQLEPTVASNST